MNCIPRSINLIAGKLLRRRARALAVMLVMTLLVTSLPASAGLGVNSAAAARSQRSLASQVYQGLGATLDTIRSWVAGYARPPAVVSIPYVPVTAYLNPVPPFAGEPIDVTVTSASATAISLSWTPPAGGASQYQIERSESIFGPFLFVGNTSGTTYNDISVTNLHAYLYRVRAVSPVGVISAPSNLALGTAITFEFQELDNQLIKAQHFHDVRTAINKVRGVAGMGVFSWARANLTGLEVKADDTTEMRTALDAALTMLSIPVTAYEDPSLTVGVTLIKATHLEQLQLRSTRGKSNSSGPVDSESSSARLDPMNETGGGGENPLSRNFNWNLPLMSLPGRAGLNLGLTLSYNSLVWTKIGTTAISFDEDNGFPGPGFRLGFPAIQPLYYNAEVGKNAFLLVGSDGSRTELRQVNTSALYESADSSHMLLDSNTMILRLTDGTQLTYELRGGEYKCAQIKDRNGNYITISHSSTGRLDMITDTLGRVITFNYNNGLLTEITQQWNQTSSAATHYWARFEYADKTIDTNFPGLTILGPADGTSIKTLSRVKLADNSYFDFSYSTWGQVYKVSNYAPDTSAQPINYRFYNLPQTEGTGLEHSDCPRFTERRDWAKYWKGDTDGTPSSSEEALTTFAVPVSDTWTMPGASSTVSGMRAQVTASDGTSNKIYFIGTPGWQRGLTALVDTYASGNSIPVRRSMTTWTQDNTSVSYPKNPRVTATNIYDDASNRARTEMTYEQFTFANGTSCHLPRDSYEYANDENPPNPPTMLRSTRITYNMSTTYTDRHIFGLVSEKQLYEGNVNNGGVLKSRVGFFYDESGSVDGTNTPIRHDSANYGASLVGGRANVTSVKRYDVTSSNVITTTRLKYNRAGSVISSKDPLDHEVTISYADSFSDGVNTRNTFAYAKTVTDPDNFSATSKYHFDFGAVTYRQIPQPNITTYAPGPEQTFTYDSIGRLQQVTNLVNNAYTRFVYPTGQIRVDTYTTIQNGLGEAHSFKITDGVGRVIATASDLPGSTGGFSGQKVVYDVMGRVIKTSNPTETSASGTPSQWTAAGDDAAAGWVYTEQTYDWKGRPLVTTNPSITGNPAETTTKQVSYSGCGCAGGDVATYLDEGTLVSGVAKRRKQKVYSDVLGRIVKTELFNWEDGGVYSATVQTYNVRDQVTQIRQYSGSESSGTFQDTVSTYDGFGRLQTRHVPEQAIGAVTTWDYNADDTLLKVTDARGASKTFGYNARHLPTGITYAVPNGSGIIVPAAVTFNYDAAGNRTKMIDGNGETNYTYDQLSRLTSESRTITGLTGTYSISYDYNLGNQLTSLTEPTQFGSTFSYVHDVVGRLTNVNGSPFDGVTSYASNAQYRAWGALKHLNYGNGKSVDATYNNRLQTATFSVSGLMSKSYQYYADGALRFSSESTSHTWDRFYSYDHTGRAKEAFSGTEARFEGLTNSRPYRETFTYDAMGHLTDESRKVWSASFASSGTYVNNRRSGWSYDADGNLLDGDNTYTYDAAGEVHIIDQGNAITGTTERLVDGDGLQIKTNNSVFDEQTWSWETTTTYYLRSTVLKGQVLTEIDSSGAKQRTFVYANGSIIAWQRMYGSVQSLTFEHRDASNASFRATNSEGSFPAEPDETRGELDPTGANTVQLPPPEPPEVGNETLVPYPRFGDPRDLGITYTIDGIRVPAEYFVRFVNFAFHGQFGLAEAAARASARVRGRRNTGVHWGTSFEAVYDENGKLVSVTWGKFDPNLSTVNFGNESPIYGDGWNFNLIPTQQRTLQTPQNTKSDCATFVDNLVGFTRQFQHHGEVEIGRGLLGMIPRDQSERERRYAQTGVSGFKERLVAPVNYQGGWVHAHVLGIVGGTLIGNKTIYPWPFGRQTGSQLVEAQMQQDRNELGVVEDMDRLGFPLYDYYGQLRPLKDVLTERRSEVASNLVGQDVGGILSSAIRGNRTFDEARKDIFRHLCDH